MYFRATLTVDLAAIEANTRRIVEAMPGVDIVGVTKVTCGSPQVAAAMLAGGVVALADSRLENIERMRLEGIDAPMWLLRPVPEPLACEAVRFAQVSLASEVTLVEALEAAADAEGRRHGIVAMVDLGDLREGMMPGEIPAFLNRVRTFGNIDVVGIGVTLSCFGGVTPTCDNLGELVALAADAERIVGHPLLVSGGTSTSIEAFAAGQMPPRVDNLRVGEAIVLGVSPLTREPILGLRTDALVVHAPVIEVGVKPTCPRGVVQQDAFGRHPEFCDRGLRRRALCAIGRQDVVPEVLRPLDERIEILGASSDHLILDVEDLPIPPCVGDTVAFVPGYAAALALFNSAYVAKEYVNAG